MSIIAEALLATLVGWLLFGLGLAIWEVRTR